MRDWERIRPRFEEFVFKRSVTEVAQRIPTTRPSVYNWIQGKCRPNVTAQARIVQIMEETDHVRTRQR